MDYPICIMKSKGRGRSVLRSFLLHFLLDEASAMPASTYRRGNSAHLFSRPSPNRPRSFDPSGSWTDRRFLRLSVLRQRRRDGTESRLHRDVSREHLREEKRVRKSSGETAEAGKRRRKGRTALNHPHLKLSSRKLIASVELVKPHEPVRKSGQSQRTEERDDGKRRRTSFSRRRRRSQSRREEP
jgi:hypothetical protein